MSANSPSSSFLRRAVAVLGALAALIGGFMLVAWFSGAAAQWSAAGAITMKTNTALGVVLASAALILLALRAQSRACCWAGLTAAVVILLIGSLTLSEHIIGWDLGIDQLLAKELPGALATASPNRMGLPASKSYVLLGMALLLLGTGRRRIVPYLGLAVILINLIPAVGFLYGIDEFFSRSRTGIAWPTVLAMISLGLGLVLACPERGPMPLFLCGDTGGKLLRGQLPMVLLLPLGLGFLSMLGQARGLYDTAMGAGLFALAMMLIFSLMLWRSATRLSHADGERKRREEELRDAKVSAEQARAAAESASRAKDQFIAVLSHELRTPLTPALAAVSMMEADMRLPGETREDLAMVRRNIALEVRLIADLLDMSRVLSGKMHLEKRPTDLAKTIREAARIVSCDLDAKGQTLTLDTPGAPYLAFADAGRLQQVFWNLVRNSIKFSPERSRIAIRARLVPVEHCPLVAKACPVGMGDCPLPEADNGDGQPRGRNLVVEVIDHGNGISPDMLKRLFTPFEQERTECTVGGLGLGLSICKSVVELHGGTISVSSEGVGRGATFTVRLPVAQCPLSAAVTQPEQSRAILTDKPLENSNPQLMILLVEDHADTARIMRRLLMAEGYDVTVAGCVAEGLAAVDAASPDLLISDLGLPDGSGLDLIRQLLAQGRRIPAIALSGYGTPADIEKSKAAGFAEHLTKPLNSVELLTAAIARLGVCRTGKKAAAPA